MDLLVIASALAMLSYVIGVIIYGSPIPYRPLKKLGISLIIDSIAAMVLILIYNVFIYIGDLILDVVNCSWSGFFTWLVTRTAALMTVFAGMTYVSALLKTSQYVAMLSPLNLALTYISLSLSALKIVYFLSSLIYNFRKELLILGVLLYSLPFKVGKGVGSFLIAASVILFVGFPLMPLFVSYFEQGIVSGSDYGLRTVRGLVTDSINTPLPYPVLLLYVDKRSDTPAAVILCSRDGTFLIGDGKDMLPKNITLRVFVEFMGYRFVTEPDTISPYDSKVVIKVPSIIYSGGIAVLIPFKYVVISKFISANVVKVSILPLEDNIKYGEIYIIKYRDADVYDIELNNKKILCNWSSFEWRGIKLQSCTLPLYYLHRANSTGKLPQFRTIEITIVHSQPNIRKPIVEEKRLLLLRNIVNLVANLISLGVALLYSLVFLPGVYVSFLLAMTTALSRVLGGGIRVKLI